MDSNNKSTMLYISGSQPAVRETFLGGMQWRILGEANEAVASGLPSKISDIVSFSCIRFFRDHYEAGTKTGK